MLALPNRDIKLRKTVMNNNTLLQTVFRSLIALSMPALPMSAICQAANAATTYDVVRDFTTKANPNGVWSYSDENGLLADKANLYQGVSALKNWSNDAAPGYNVTILRNRTDAPVTLYDGVLTIPVNYLMLSPDSNVTAANVVFRAPSAGTYTVKGNFLGLDRPEAFGTRLNIIENGSKYIYGTQYARSGVKRRFRFVLSLAAGDTLDFQSEGSRSKGRYDVGLTVKIIGP
jgi:hypothetical protein